MAPTSWAVALAGSIMERNPGTRQDALARWSYRTGYTLLGFEMLWRTTGDGRYWDFIRRHMGPFIDEEGGLVGVSLDSLDNIMPGNVIVALYEHTGEERYRRAASTVRHAFDDYPRNADGGFWHAKRLPGEMWVDGVFMGQMCLIRYGASIGDAEYCFDEAVRQITIFAGHGRKGDSGLYLHAWAAQPDLPRVKPGNVERWASPETGLSSEVWSEGLGWYALVLAETLAVLPASHRGRAEVVDIFSRLAEGLARAQDPLSGGWFQVVDEGGRPGNWVDTSGTAMFTYALQRAVEIGVLEEAEFEPLVRRGYQCILQNATANSDGLINVHSACDGLCVQQSYDAYIRAPRVTNAMEAVAGFLWATAIVEKPGPST
ncbi:MAG TPA: glycoside hydrolase family 88 protein [Acidimicrobiales bacterium]|nr:glycoside hydrolase family 88 protein [Acidimicrobiales bacterium]